jgi:hypothetical protein
MLRRLVVGLILGLVVGGLVAAGLVAGLHVSLFGPGTEEAVFAYLAAAVTGVLTGLVAGKPIWASGARIEAGLKAFFGALLGAGLMFAARRWVSFPLDLAFAGLPGSDHAGWLPEVSLPLVAAVLGGFFELDNNGSAAAATEAKDTPKARIADEKAGKANGKGKARVAGDGDPVEEETTGPVASKRAKR